MQLQSSWLRLGFLNLCRPGTQVVLRLYSPATIHEQTWLCWLPMVLIAALILHLPLE